MSEIAYLKTACEHCSGRIEYPSALAGQFYRVSSLSPDDAAIGTVRHKNQGRVRHPAVMILLVRRYIRVPQSTEWRNIGNEIKADFVVTRTDFRKPASGQCTSMAMVSAVELGAALV